MSRAKKSLVGVGVFLLLMGGVGAIAGPPEEKPAKEPVQSTAEVKAASDEHEAPVIETKTEQEVKPVPHKTTIRYDSTLASGHTEIAVRGVNGEQTITYEVTYQDGVETARKQLTEQITKQPITQIKKIGTKLAVAPAPKPKPKPHSSNCDPNYSGACVPIASDVDCDRRTGRGNGPAYVIGPVYVIGTDIYKLDGNGDGVGCENY